MKRYPCEHAFHHQIDSPVLAIELASTRAEVETVLAPPCASYFEIYSDEAQSTIATAISDYAENIGIFRSLALSPSDILAQWTSWPSRFKWTMFAVSLLLTFVILLRSQNPMYSLATRRLFALGYLTTGTLLAMGVWRPTLIGLGLQIYAVIVLLQITPCSVHTLHHCSHQTHRVTKTTSVSEGEKTT